MIDANVGVEELIHILNMSCDERKPPGNQGGNFLPKRKWQCCHMLEIPCQEISQVLEII